MIDQLQNRSEGRAGIRRLVRAYAQRTSTGADELIRRMRAVIESVGYASGTGEVTIRLRTRKEHGDGQQPE